MPTAGPNNVPTPPLVIPNDRTTSKGTRLYYKLLGGATFVRLAAITGISGPNLTRENVDTTELDQVPDSLGSGEADEHYYWKGSHPGTKEAAAVNVACNMSANEYVTLQDLFNRDAICLFEIRFRARGSETSGGKLTFTGFVESIGHEIEEGALVKVPVTFKPSTRVVYVLPGGVTTTVFP